MESSHWLWAGLWTLKQLDVASLEGLLSLDTFPRPPQSGEAEYGSRFPENSPLRAGPPYPFALPQECCWIGAGLLLPDTLTNGTGSGSTPNSDHENGPSGASYLLPAPSLGAHFPL